MLRKTVGYCLQTLIIKCIKLKQKKCVNTFIRIKLYLIFSEQPDNSKFYNARNEYEIDKI